MKRKGSILGIIIIVLIIVGFFTFKNLIETKNGTINLYTALNLKLDKILNNRSTDEETIKEIRDRLNKDSLKFSKSPIPFSNIKDINIEVSSSKIPIRIYTPEDGEMFPIIIYSHGGSWIAGNLDTHDNVCRKLSKNTKAIVISVDYRLAPENPFPQALDDVYNVLQWTNANAKSINGDVNRVAMVGDSAGGNLSAAVCLMSKDKNGPKVTCQVLIYPSTNLYELNTKSWSDFSNDFNISKEEMEKYISLYVPQKEDRKNPYVSPLLSNEFKQLPDTLVITAEIDPLRDEGEAYSNKLKNSGIKTQVITFNGVTHGFITMDKITSKADEALNEISSYLQNEFEN